jgi:hypothetical protein
MSVGCCNISGVKYISENGEMISSVFQKHYGVSAILTNSEEVNMFTHKPMPIKLIHVNGQSSKFCMCSCHKVGIYMDH